jgi:hypothetical protein
MKMKKILFKGVGVTLLVFLSAIVSTTSAFADEQQIHERAPLLYLEGVEVVADNDIIEIEDGGYQNGVAPRWGYQWRCKTRGCGYKSAWHAMYSSASKYALAHHQKYGHTVTVFGV